MALDDPGQAGEAAPKLYQSLDRTAAFPYTRSEYLRRAAWGIVSATLYRLPLPRMPGWRRFLLRAFGAKLDPTCNIRPGVRVVHPWLLAVGKFSCLGDGVRVYNLGRLSVGDHTVISQNVHLCGGTHDYKRRDLPLLRRPIVIGSGVWVCADAFIGPGVTVGDNSVVGARAVVVADVPAATIVAGNPARVVKERPRPEA